MGSNCSLTDDRIMKDIYLYRNAVQPQQNDFLMFVAAWVDLEGMRLSEMGQRERQIPYDLTY